MADKSENPFTNVRLMLAGIIFGVIGAALAFYYIHKKIEVATGRPVLVCYLKKNLDATDGLTRDDVDQLPVPEHFAKATTKLVKYRELNRYLGRKPFRNMKNGEPLSVYDFPYSKADARQTTLPLGTVSIALPIDAKSQPGKALRLGSIVSLTANIKFGEARAGAKADIQSLTILEKVRVRTINGSDETQQVDKVKSIGVIVSERTSRRLTQLLDLMSGGLKLSTHSEQEMATTADNEIPKATLSTMADKGLPPVM